jgi:citrate lyase beta subunit
MEGEMLILTEDDEYVNITTALPEGFMASRFARFAVPHEADAERRLISHFSSNPNEGLLLTDARSPADIEKASALLRVAAAEAGQPSLCAMVLASIDTPQAALGIAGFNRPVPGIGGLILDEGALTDALGMDAGGAPLDQLRLQVLLAAKVCGVIALQRAPGAGPEDASRSVSLRQGFKGLVVKSGG